MSASNSQNMSSPPEPLRLFYTGIRDDRESYFPAIRCKQKEKSPAEKFLGKNMPV